MRLMTTPAYIKMISRNILGGIKNTINYIKYTYIIV